ncbi:hypothetical protein O9992_24545 [Vibrio lentus]|nr:hypothetical protein [Vibrio lentus]
MMSTSTEPADYTIVGDSSMNDRARRPTQWAFDSLSPTHLFLTFVSDLHVQSWLVALRIWYWQESFSNGRVLYRTDFHGKNMSF